MTTPADENGTGAARRRVFVEPQHATAASVAGLAREVDTVRRDVGRLGELPCRVDELADVVAGLADAVSGMRPASTPAAPVSWLRPLPIADGGRDPLLVLTELSAWVGSVFLQYDDGWAVLPPCWLWHPDVVEELCWLHQTWHAAYRGDTASAQLAGDWHDRQRPGVVERIRRAAGTCSIETHTTPVAVAERAPLVSAVAAVASWWTTDRTSPPPLPTAEQVAEAARLPRRKPSGRKDR